MIWIPLHAYKPYSRKNINKNTVNLITPGQTSFEDIMLMLGEPDDVEINRDFRQISYRTTVTSEYAAVSLFPYGPITEATSSESCTLKILLNKSSVVIKTKYSCHHINY